MNDEKMSEKITDDSNKLENMPEVSNSEQDNTTTNRFTYSKSTFHDTFSSECELLAKTNDENETSSRKNFRNKFNITKLKASTFESVDLEGRIF